MTHPLATYTFLPWLREGIANRITAADGDTGVAGRAGIDVTLRITGHPAGGGAALEREVSRTVDLYGPGDVVGIDGRQIVRTEPRDWITNFEPNYLPHVDFYDADFCWRYTPAAHAAGNRSRLRPWLALVVLTEDEFTDGRAGGDRPLPFVTVDDASVFPPADELWAWAHVHANAPLVDPAEGTLVAAEDNAAVLDGLRAALDSDPDVAYCRLLSPRRLTPNTAYHAFVVPSFERGRLAGLGLDPDAAPHATHAAWEDHPGRATLEPTRYPYYHRWYFRTGTVGDFEYLVRLLEPRPIDSRVGRRDIDVRDPGGNLPGIDGDLGGVLRVGGALRVPRASLSPEEEAEERRFEDWDEPAPHEFQERLAELVNLADDYPGVGVGPAHEATGLEGVDTGDHPDPIVTAPLYGRWHALQRRLLRDADGTPLPERDGWVHELNLDPRFRAAAGFGTEVVKADQEAYMEAAWRQIGDVLEGNRRIRRAQLAREVTTSWHARHLSALAGTDTDALLSVTAPAAARVRLAGGVTRAFSQRGTHTPPAVLSAPMRRIARPLGPLARRLGLAGPQGRGLLARLDARELQAAPPKEVPGALGRVDGMAEAAKPRGTWLLEALRGWPRSTLLPLLLVVVLLVALVAGLAAGAVAAVAVAVLAAIAALLARRGLRRLDAARDLAEDRDAGAAERLPTSPDFVLTAPAAPFEPATGGPDSPTAARFKRALAETDALIGEGRAAGARPPRVPWGPPAVVPDTLAALDARVTIPRRTLAQVRVPARIREALGERFAEVMAYPEFDLPAYEPLVARSAEHFLPGIEFIGNNTMSLLETNQRFIEAYMVGLNHEFARELLWREYPTDQRGTPFRQFWDVSSVLARADADPEALRESLRDIPPLHRWPRASALGDHDHRERGGEAEEEVVLLVRGELLKKYPNAVILAHRAEWQRDAGGAIDRTLPRRLVPLTPAEEDDPPPAKVLTPLYEAKVDPDISLFAFDLTAEAAAGETDEDPDDPGWFFVIKERPGEPRFGLDERGDDDGGGGPARLWSDIAWDDLTPDPGAGGFLSPSAAPAATLAPPVPSATDAERTQHDEDVGVRWDAAVSSAELAYILYQVPVLVAVHATKMLPGPRGSS